MRVNAENAGRCRAGIEGSSDYSSHSACSALIEVAVSVAIYDRYFFEHLLHLPGKCWRSIGGRVEQGGVSSDRNGRIAHFWLVRPHQA